MIENARLLKAVVAQWLRYERGCMLVLIERPPRYPWFGVPDVVGVGFDRTVIEVEVKCSLSDFKANDKKRVMAMRKQGVTDPPRQFYFMVPRSLVDKVEHLMPSDAGLLTTHESAQNAYTGLPFLVVERKAAACKASRRMTLKELAVAVRHQSGTLVSTLAALAKATCKTTEEPV